MRRVNRELTVLPSGDILDTATGALIMHCPVVGNHAGVHKGTIVFNEYPSAIEGKVWVRADVELPAITVIGSRESLVEVLP